MSNWFAILKDRDDNDWGTGSFNFNKAVKMANENNYELIAEISGFDKDGNVTSDLICTKEYIKGEDF